MNKFDFLSCILCLNEQTHIQAKVKLKCKSSIKNFNIITQIFVEMNKV